jgi:PPP family 3-phenylpropionic acid transporter
LIIRFKPSGLLVFSLVFTGIRFIIYGFAFTPVFVFFGQILNGFSIPIMWVAGVAYADKHAPDGMRTTAQGLFSAMVLGFGAAVGGFVGGLLLENIGGRGLYLIFAMVVFSILLMVTLIRRNLAPEKIQVASFSES